MAKEKTRPPFLIWGMPLLLFVSFFLYMYFGGMRGSSPIERAVVVLPFDVATHDEESAILAEGFRKDLIDVLGRNPAIQVRGNLVEQEEGLSLSGTALGVKFLVADERFELRARLRDLAKDREVWLNIYDDDLNAERFFIVRKELANAIAKSLKTIWSPAVRSSLQRIPTSNLDAMIAFYQGREAYQSYQPEQLAPAIEFLQQAIALDDEFGEAFAFLALTFLKQIELQQLDPAAQIELASPVLQTARRLEPASAAVHLASGIVDLYRGNETEALSAFERAIELNPHDVQSHVFIGLLLAVDPARAEEGESYLERAEALRTIY